MSGLTDALRERVSRRGRTAQVSCGALGTLTVEALSPQDCAALSRQGGRAVLYAACRELQMSGEELRREGLVYRPDEITRYITDREAAAAARTVLSLSGFAPEEPKKPGKPEEPEESETPEELEEPEEPEEPEAPELTPPSPVPRPPAGGGEFSRGSPLPLEGAGGNGAERTSGGSRTERSGIFDSAGRLGFVHPSGTEFPEIRLKPVRTAGAALPESPENRPDFVRKAGTEFPEVRLNPVRIERPEKRPAPPEAEPETPRGKTGGQASREFLPSEEPRAENAAPAGEIQHLPEKLQKPLQDVEEQTEKGKRRRREKRRRENAGEKPAREIKSESGAVPLEAPREIKSEFREAAHEITSESEAVPLEAPREIESEFREAAHEITSESGAVPLETAHEITSESEAVPLETAHEIRSEFREAAHETRSEFEAVPLETAHEIKSETGAEPVKKTAPPETGPAQPDMERIARALLEGLRLAAGAR